MVVIGFLILTFAALRSISFSCSSCLFFSNTSNSSKNFNCAFTSVVCSNLSLIYNTEYFNANSKVHIINITLALIVMDIHSTS